jgi:hypothetical protein
MSMVSGNGSKSDFGRWDCIDMPGTRPLPLTRTLTEVRGVVQGRTAAHRVLRGRIADVVVLTVLIDLAASVATWALEDGHGDIHGFGDAVFWTTSQLLTISSSYANPAAAAGKILDVVLELYALTVVTSLAGMFASFFHHRSVERRADAPATP